MRIYSLDLLSGKVPDPYYKNLLWYPDIYDPESSTSVEGQTRNALGTIEGVNRTMISVMSQLDDKTVYAISETPTVCSLVIARPEIRTLSELYDLAQYIIIHELKADGVHRTFSFWFVMNLSVLSEGKFRIDLQRDEWSCNWSKYINTPIQFTRRHTRRWVQVDPNQFLPIFNGLSDPVAESMVMSKTHDEPAPVFGSSRVNISGVGYVRPVILWRYIRFNDDNFAQKTGTDEHGQPIYQAMVPPNAIPLKDTIPTAAYPLGIAYRADDTSKTYFHPVSYIYNGTQNFIVPFNDVISLSSPFIAESFISTRPPCPVTWEYYTTGGITYLRVKAVTGEGNPTPTIYPAYTIYFGGANRIPLPSGAVYSIGYPNIRESYSYSFSRNPEWSNTATEEPKIQEAPYSSKTLKLGTARIDLSPAPGREQTTVEIPFSLGTSAIVKGDGKEIAEVAGWWSGMQSETISDALNEWLIANRNTYETGRYWQLVNTIVGVGKGLGSHQFGQAAGSLISGVQHFSTEEARIKDIASAPDSATIPTTNAFDNLPFVDHPLIAVTETIDEAKAKIIAFWRRYGYPDNSTAAMKDAITRDEFVYMQGTPTVPTPGIIPPRQSWFNSSVSSGVYLWRIHDTDGVLSTSYGESLDPADITNKDEV